MQLLRLVLLMFAVGSLGAGPGKVAETESQARQRQLMELTTAEPVSAPCTRQKRDRKNYLLETCRYVVEQKVPVSSHPNTWTIQKIEDEDVKGTVFLAVHFSCCGAGDVSLFDKGSGKLVEYSRKSN